MSMEEVYWTPRQVIMQSGGRVCETTQELVDSPFFADVVQHFLQDLRHRESPLLEVFADWEGAGEEGDQVLVDLLRALNQTPLDRVVREILPRAASLARRPELLHELVEELYNYWRRFDRFLVCRTEQVTGDYYDVRPYTTFNNTVEKLTHVVRAAYRDVCENITGDHPRVYRQVAAGAQMGLIAVKKPWPCPGGPYMALSDVPLLRQLLIQPPLILDPPMNKREGQFARVSENPLQGMTFPSAEWMCYPAQVGPLVIFIYYHRDFMGLGSCLANLFELATEEQIMQKPDAIYAYGVDSELMSRFGDLPTVFYEDEAEKLLVAAVPRRDRFGYFGYLKKMVLTLHNIVMMKQYRRMPFHGAMVRIVLKNELAASVLIIGDTGAGKSESLEAFRLLGEDYIRDLRVVADDMGSLEVDGEVVRGYGTEIGAFVRLDDLQPGYAFGQLDRAVIMSPQKINARAIMPVTTTKDVLRGYPVHYLLYANNFEDVTEEQPLLERFASVEEALEVFRRGAAMAKGTTTSTGLVESYFANIFGPPQYQEVHEELARYTFQAAWERDIYIGQMRTRLGLDGYQLRGPEEAARALFAQIQEGTTARMPQV